MWTFAVVAPVARRRSTRAARTTAPGTSGARPNDAWLFPSEALRTPISYSNIWRRRIGPALKAAGIAGANYQVLRRTWVTHIAEAERDATIRAKLAGHSVEVHENVYRQPDASAMRKAMRRLEKLRE